MSNGNSQPEVRFERIDADAVCAQCGTVNPEDTLLCKTCGNNLRDQRARRVVGLPAEETAEPQRLSKLAKLLALFGILLVLWVALNMKHIENAMLGIQSQDSDADIYWSYSPDRGSYNEMLSELQGNPVTPEEAEQAQQAAANDASTVDGRYALVASNAMSRKYVVGQANVRLYGDRILFVALLDSGFEVRGEAIFEGTNRIAARDSIGVKRDGKYFGGSGLAQKVDTGGYDCAGVNDFDSQIASFKAYKINQ
jgi:hypothetical protein